MLEYVGTFCSEVKSHSQTPPTLAETYGVTRVDYSWCGEGIRVCVGISQKNVEWLHNSGSGHRIVIRNVPADPSWNGNHFGHSASVGISRKNVEWLHKLGSGYRIVKRNVPAVPSWNGNQFGRTASVGISRKN